LLKINFFIYFLLFWCVNLKNNFLKIKNIILIYIDIKNTLKSNCNYIPKQPLISIHFHRKNFVKKVNTAFIVQLFLLARHCHFMEKREKRGHTGSSRSSIRFITLFHLLNCTPKIFSLPRISFNPEKREIYPLLC